ncbi:hypothetical protein Sjap_008798 [Stephania japonica]|uniref:Uncharacterized protein n=1 Tax=Stephania japonica TaxID=461633 RepID=A0AAP0PCP9_9MAGN
MLKKLYLIDCPKLIIPFAWVFKLPKVKLVNIQRIVGAEASEHPKSDNQDVDTTTT